MSPAGGSIVSADGSVGGELGRGNVAMFEYISGQTIDIKERIEMTYVYHHVYLVSFICIFEWRGVGESNLDMGLIDKMITCRLKLSIRNPGFDFFFHVFTHPSYLFLIDVFPDTIFSLCFCSSNKGCTRQ